MKVYLINKYDPYCPENNNGDCIEAVFLDRQSAQRFVKTENAQKDSWGKCVIKEMELSGKRPATYISEADIRYCWHECEDRNCPGKPTIDELIKTLRSEYRRKKKKSKQK